MITSEPIFSYDNNGTLRFWYYEVDGATWRGVSGQVNGAAVESGWTVCVPKSKDTAEEQALFEAKAEEKKKLDRKYRRTVEELDAGVFEAPMLAKEYDKLKKPLVFPVAAQPKLDGIRAVISIAGAFTRQGKPIPSADHIVKALQPVFEDHPDLVLDGELYNHALKDDFNELSSLIRKQKITDEQRAEIEAKVQYHVYDICDESSAFAARTLRLKQIFELDWEVPGIELVQTVIVNNQEALDQLLEEWLIDGYEGQMVRIPSSLYALNTRSPSLLKRKDFVTEEFKLLRIEEGNGNWRGLAKRVVIELEDGRENEAGIRGNMARAKELLENRAYYEGGEVTVRFMRQRTPDGKLRAAVAIDFHPEGRKD